MAHDFPNTVDMKAKLLSMSEVMAERDLETKRLKREIKKLRKLCAAAAEDMPQHDPANHSGGIQAVMSWIEKLAAAGRGEAEQ